MELKFYVEEFIKDNLSIEQIIKITGFSVSSVVRIIYNYYKMNNIDMPEYIKKRINYIYLDMYNMRKDNNPYYKIANKYNTNVLFVKDSIIKYCKENNIKLLDNVTVFDNSKKRQAYQEEFVHDMYEYKLSGLSYEKIGEIYNCSHTKIRLLLVEYCKNNNLELPHAEIFKNSKKEICLTPKEMYDLRLKNKSYDAIASKCKCSTTKIRNEIKIYCKENNLKVPNIKTNYYNNKKIDIPLDEMYELKRRGMSNKKIAIKYNCSENTIYRRLDSYLKERLLMDFYLMLQNENEIVYKDNEDYIKSLV